MVFFFSIYFSQQRWVFYYFVFLWVKMQNGFLGMHKTLNPRSCYSLLLDSSLALQKPLSSPNISVLSLISTFSLSLFPIKVLVYPSGTSLCTASLQASLPRLGRLYSQCFISIFWVSTVSFCLVADKCGRKISLEDM